jgi:putative resolvase
VKLSEWAEQEGIHYQTAWRWFRDGQLPVPAIRTPSGTILVEVPRSVGEPYGRVVVYARVFSYDQRADLDRQVARMTEWATKQGMTVSDVVTEVGSGVNGRRRKLTRLLADASVTTIVVEHRDRLTRFGMESLEAALSAQGRRVVVADPGDMDDDLVRDVTEVLTIFCARLYGRRGARNRAEKALNCAKNDVGPMALARPGASRPGASVEAMATARCSPAGDDSSDREAAVVDRGTPRRGREVSELAAERSGNGDW